MRNLEKTAEAVLNRKRATFRKIEDRNLVVTYICKNYGLHNSQLQLGRIGANSCNNTSNKDVFTLYLK